MHNGLRSIISLVHLDVDVNISDELQRGEEGDAAEHEKEYVTS